MNINCNYPVTYASETLSLFSQMCIGISVNEFFSKPQRESEINLEPMMLEANILRAAFQKPPIRFVFVFFTLKVT